MGKGKHSIPPHNNNILYHQISTTFGNSGSPIMIKNDQ